MHTGVLAVTEGIDAPQVFLAIAVVVVVARLIGALFTKIRQPPVVGEILAGILLGPSLLGAFPGNPTDALFPLEIRPTLSVIAQLGLVFFMFIVGLELDTGLIRGKERIAAVVSVSSVLLPFAMGIGLAVYLHSDHSVIGGEEVDVLPFALFIGASMSVTAFPVLARILTDRGMYRTAVGALALACAAVDDILAWSLLAVVLAVVSSGSALDLPLILVESLAFVAVMFLVVRPLLARLAARYREVGRLTPILLSTIVVGILVSSYITAEIGIHEIFGAFVFGVVMPREDTRALFHEILEKLEPISALILLPVFFIITGLNVDVRGLGAGSLGPLLLILAVACLGKFLGASLAARAQGVPGPQARAIGVLMNTRGLTELVILNIGLEFGVLDDELFTMLVIMAVLTTIITEPALRLFYPDRVLERDIAEAERALSGIVDAHRVVVLVDDLDDGAANRRMVDLAIELADGEDPAEVVLANLLPPRRKAELLGAGLTDELFDMATSLEVLHQLEGRATDRGVPASTRSQYVDDPALTLRGLGLALGVDLVLVRRAAVEDGRVDLDKLTHDHPFPVAVVALGAQPAPGDEVRVVGLDDDQPAAGEVALRLAHAGRRPLVLVDAGGRRRRRASLTPRIDGVPVDVRVEVAEGERADAVAARAAGALVVVSAAASGAARAGLGAAAVLVVDPIADDDGRTLDRLVERLGEQRRTVEPGGA